MTIFTSDTRALPSLPREALSVNVKGHVEEWITRLPQAEHYGAIMLYMTVDALALRLVLGALKSTEEILAKSTDRITNMVSEHNLLKDQYNELMRDFTERGTELHKAGEEIAGLQKRNDTQFQLINERNEETGQLRHDNADLLTRLNDTEISMDNYRHGFLDSRKQIADLELHVSELEANQDFDLNTINTLQDQLNTAHDQLNDYVSAPADCGVSMVLAETVRAQAEIIASLTAPKVLASGGINSLAPHDTITVHLCRS